MDEYLKEFGISPKEVGLDKFIKTRASAERIVKNNKWNDTADGKQNMSGNKFSDTLLKNLPLAMAYVPFQKIEGTYNQEEALKAGTLFPNLDKPFLGRRP